MGSNELLASATTRLASTERLDEIADTVVRDIVALGFGAVWMAMLEPASGMLLTLKSVVDGNDITSNVPKISVNDLRQPIAHGFRERRMINVTDPDAVFVIDRDDDTVPPGRLALPRAVYDRLRGQPFACGPLFGGRGQPVGAFGLGSYRGKQPIPDDMLSHGPVRTFMDHLGFAIERALHVEQLNASLSKAQEVITADARIKAVGELASAVAHDLNHLAGIALLAASVGRRSPAAALDVLPRIELANRAIGDLVARLQRLARPASGELDAANPSQIVEDILIMVKPLLLERSIEVEAELPAMPPVRCDPVLIQQVALNLVINAHDALDAVPAERRRIKVRLRDDGGVVRLIIADTGPGIPAEVLPRLFQPYVTTKRNAHLGIGLAAAQSSLRHFGAKIEGRNAASGGAVFEVTFAVAPPAVPISAAQDKRPAPAHEARRPARILAIDDDPDLVYLIRAYLEPHGYTVTTTTGSAEALAIARAESFDLVLCDIGMPEHSGLDISRALRSASYAGKLVLMTGWDSYGASDEQRSAACDALLKKPFVGDELLHLIDALLAN